MKLVPQTSAKKVSAPARGRLKRLCFLGARIGITASLLYLAVRRMQWGTFFFNLQHVRITYFLAGVAALLAQTLLAGIRWGRIVRICGIPLKDGDGVRYTFAAAFFNQTLPASVGGDAVRSWLLRKRYSNWSAPIYSVIIDRSVGGIALATLVLATLPMGYALIAQQAARLSLVLVGLSCLAAFASVLLVGGIPWRTLDRIAGMKYLRMISQIVLSAMTVRTGGTILAISIIIHLLSALSVWCMAAAIHAPLSLAGALVLVPPIMLIVMVPISIAGWGVRESAMVAILAYAGVSNPLGFLISLLFGAASLLVGIAGGAQWLLYRERDATIGPEDSPHPPPERSVLPSAPRS